MPLSIIRRFASLGLALIVSLAILHPAVQAQDGRSTYPTEQALAEAMAPPRDRAELAQRLLGVTDIPAPPASPERVYQVGDVERFFAQNDETGLFEVKARLVYTNEVVYMWLEGGYDVDVDAVKDSADDFAERVYQQVRAVFGSEWSPGIDGDPKLHILMVSNLGGHVAAYYYSEGEYPREAVSSSNEKEMFYVNLDTMLWDIGTDYFVGVLAHEFQHMIHRANDANETAWLNEGASELASYIAGYGASGFVPGFLSSPNVQLNNMDEDGRAVVYGASFRYLAYLLERFGTDFMRTLIADPDNGFDSVQDTLDAFQITDPQTGAPMTAEQVFADWTVANYLNNTAIADGRYGYRDPLLAGQGAVNGNIRTFNAPPVDLSGSSVNQWATNYYVVRGDGSLTLSFNGSVTTQLLPVNAHSGQFAYWSNRVDLSDTRLTREFDLTGVQSATLNFWTWYDIEELWDFAYVMVSPDGGATWDLLETSRTNRENPYNTGYGPGYSGDSRGWVQETLDLSAYAGQRILLRFEYITDDAVVRSGFLLDDVSIPEIGYAEGFEQPDTGWLVEGWVRTDNVLPQPFSLQVIERRADGSVTVRRLLEATNAPDGEWTLAQDGAVQEWVIVVSGLAPVTTLPAAFDLQIRPQ